MTQGNFRIVRRVNAYVVQMVNTTVLILHSLLHEAEQVTGQIHIGIRLEPYAKAVVSTPGMEGKGKDIDVHIQSHVNLMGQAVDEIRSRHRLMHKGGEAAVRQFVDKILDTGGCLYAKAQITQGRETYITVVAHKGRVEFGTVDGTFLKIAGTQILCLGHSRAAQEEAGHSSGQNMIE